MENEDLETFKSEVMNMLKLLDEKIEALNDCVVNQIINPAIEQYKEDQYQDFKGKYGERLDKYSDILKQTNGEDYDNTRAVWDDIQNGENPEGVDIEATVSEAEKQTLDFVNSVREKMGLPPEEAITITSDNEGNVEVKADEDGDGNPETTVADTETTETEESSNDENKETEEAEDDETEEVDPELQKELEEMLKK